MDLVIQQKKIEFAQVGKGLLHAFLGSLFIAFSARFQIPLYPVPMTLQTLALFILAFQLGPKRAFGAAVFYLLEASLGFPVLSAGSQPLWMVAPCAGYLVGFPLAAYLIGKMRLKKPHLLWQAFSIFCGQLVIYSLGFLWLAYFLGREAAFVSGVVVFIPSAALKMILTITYNHLFKKRFGSKV